MIFLSASIPTPGRMFYGSEDIIAIREAIMAFTKVCMDKHLSFYFGGHPAITPIIWEVAKEYSPLAFKKFIRIYQSSYYRDKTPKEVTYFDNIVWTDRRDSSAESIELMRNCMFSDNKTSKAVFIGGMDGVLVEYEMIKQYYPTIEVLPMSTTGAASKKLYQDLALDNPDLSDNYSYVSVFKKYL